MKTTEHCKDNKPIVNSLLTGLFYLIFGWSLDFGDNTKVLFMILMLFLQGLTFPLTTCYYKTEKKLYSDVQKVTHLAISDTIYYGSVWLFSGEVHVKNMSVLAGFLGSLLFLIVTKYLLKKNISLIQILLTSIGSGLVFFQYDISGHNGLLLGTSVFLWTIVNGLTLNIEYRKAQYR
ncbi:hypothetical protein [Flectobacillus roseus]|uniref:Uncharacterized protein n=1 Tax=Flectobacillus roseus TaxID=502259 RepID=A0ABT6YFV6_9BACT|nr:hypothetical protein [Flectobacillus roseus]MDI9862314.1 hypothetical protein [Flectobacillus roseus]